MMRIFGLLLMLALFFSCASQKEVAQNKKGRCAIKDSAQYELIVFDSGSIFGWQVTKTWPVNTRKVITKV